jgi:hypothetical protein
MVAMPARAKCRSACRPPSVSGAESGALCERGVVSAIWVSDCRGPSQGDGHFSYTALTELSRSQAPGRTSRDSCRHDSLDHRLVVWNSPTRWTPEFRFCAAELVAPCSGCVHEHADKRGSNG